MGRKRIERLMKATGIAGVSRRKAARTTFRDERVAGVRSGRSELYADAPDQLWVADITYIPTCGALTHEQGPVPGPVLQGFPFLRSMGSVGDVAAFFVECE